MPTIDTANHRKRRRALLPDRDPNYPPQDYYEKREHSQQTQDMNKNTELASDYWTVRNDPDYPEKLDAEIIPLCDALNEAGFTTNASCCGHGTRWPSVWFTHGFDEEVEQLARRIMRAEIAEHRLHFSVFSKHVLADGYNWNLAIHLTDVYGDTPHEVFLQKAVDAIDWVTSRLARNWPTIKR